MQPQRTRRDTEDRFKNSVLSVLSVVKSGDFYRLCGIDLTTTQKTPISKKLVTDARCAGEGTPDTVLTYNTKER